MSLVVAKPSVETYTCPANITHFDNGTEYFNGSYNQVVRSIFVCFGHLTFNN